MTAPSFPPAALLAAALALAALPGLPDGAGAQALRYTRPLEVVEPGWVRVPLGPEILRQTSAGGLRLVGPEGQDLPLRRVPVEMRPLRRPASAGAPVPAEGGWWIPVEVAPGPRLHERLVIELEGRLARAPAVSRGALAVRLEGSPDGEAWRVLGVGQLLPVEGEADRFTVSYPATELRHLRLFWPLTSGAAGTGGPPRISGAAADEIPAGSSRLSLTRPECRTGETGPDGAYTVCRLPLEGAGRYLRDLCVLVASSRPAGYRLLTPGEGRWKPVIEGVWTLPGEDVARCLRVEIDLSEQAEPLRLEVYGSEGEVPSIRAVNAELAPEDIVFRAPLAGLYTLVYGSAVVVGSPEIEGPLPPADQATRIEPGPQEATEVPVEPIAVPTTAVPAPAVSWQETWRVRAEAPEAGGLFRLTLPPDVYAVTRPELPDLRLLRSGDSSRAQVPFARWRPEAPELAAELRGAEPRPGGGNRRVRIEISEPGLPLSALVASALPAGEAGGESSRRRVRVLYVAPGPSLGTDRDDAADSAGESVREAPAARTAGPWVEWTCRSRSPLPCRVTLGLAQTPARRLILEIDDQGARPLPWVDLELWRHRDVLLFPWPRGADGADGAGAPVLAAGADGVEPADLGLSGRLDELLARPWQEAQLVLEEDGEGGAGRLGKWAIGLALLVAHFVLLFLLHRILAEHEARPDRGGGSPPLR